MKKRKITRKKRRSAQRRKGSIQRKPLFWKDKTQVSVILLILLFVFIAFYPSLNNEFVNWDDDRNIYENELIVNLTPANFWEHIILIFQTPVIGNYNPLSIFSFAIEKLAFGLEQPIYWHLDNLILHLICVFLVFRMGQLLGLNLFACAILALLFGIHPMRVESVAWVTERKDVLFGSFYLAALIIYIQYHKGQRSTLRMVLIYLLFVLSLLSKIQAVALPLSMLCIDYYLNRKISFSLIKEKIPFFLLSLAFGIIGIFFLQGQGSLESNATYALYNRPFVGSYSLLVYLIKSLVPYQLVPLYPYPGTVPWYFYASIAFVPFYFWLIYYAWKKEMKSLLFGVMFFLFNIVFMLQILGAGQGFIADRFSYIAYFGLFFIFAVYGQQLHTKFPKYKHYLTGAAAALILVYAGITFQQCKIWKNGESLWTHVLKYNDQITLPFGNRANYYRDSGQHLKAMADYTSLIRLDPNKAGSYNSRAKLYFNSSNNDTLNLALRDYSRAIELDPTIGEYWINRGAVYARLRQTNQSLSDLNRGLELDPTRDSGYLNRSVVHNMMGHWQESITDIDRYLTFKAFAPDIIFERGRAKMKIGQIREAVADFGIAIQQNPNRGLFYYERSRANFRLNQIDQARADARIALQLNERIDPDYLAQLGL